VRLSDVAKAVSAKVEHLQSGRRRWQKWANVDADVEGSGKAYLQDLEKIVHGNSWPVEWADFRDPTEDFRNSTSGFRNSTSGF
jgi:hypothetical protein